MSKNVELIAALCTALTFACAVQILITCFLAFAFSQFMSVLHCNLATAAGVLSGLVSVPTVIQLRAAQVSSVGRKYGYTVLYKRLAISVCAILQTITWFCTIINIFTRYEENTFLSVMVDYGVNQSSKSIVDNIQWFLQCCGSKNHRDWYQLNWGGYRKKLDEFLFLNEYPDLTGFRKDSVPFSCCAENVRTPCVHQDLEQLGTYTINTSGCTERLASTKQSILWTEFAIYSICLILEITILTLLLRDSDAIPSQAVVKYFHRDERKQFSKFLNQHSTLIESDSN